MRRPSQVIEDLVRKLDGFSGRCYSLRNSEEHAKRVLKKPFPYIAVDIALLNADAISTGVAQGLEYLIARPLYHIENSVGGKSPPPGWIFSR